MPVPPHHHQPLLPTSTAAPAAATWARRRRFPRRQQQRAGWACLALSALLPALALLAWALGGSDAQAAAGPAAGLPAERLDDEAESSVGPAANRVVLEVVQGNATLGNVTVSDTSAGSRGLADGCVTTKSGRPAGRALAAGPSLTVCEGTDTI